MSAIVFEDNIIHYEVLGRGRPLLFLHGWIGSWRYWITTMQALSINYRTYALDLWGFGDTAKKPERYTLNGQLNLMDGFMNQMGILRIALVGHGLGAIIALRYAELHPDTVDRLMVIGLPLEAKMVNSRLRSDSPSVLAEWLLKRNPLTEPARVDAPKTDVKAISVSLNNLESGEGIGKWQNYLPPTLLVYGENDPAVQLPAERLRESLPEQTHIIFFDQSGHFPMLDDSNKFNRLLLDFLSLKSGESPRQLQLKEQWKRRVR